MLLDSVVYYDVCTHSAESLECSIYRVTCVRLCCILASVPGLPRYAVFFLRALIVRQNLSFVPAQLTLVA